MCPAAARRNKTYVVVPLYLAEDGGIFWSNDPQIPVMEMIRGLGLELPADSLDRNRRLQDRLRGGPPSGE
jgi:hypothetical protein